MTATLAEIAGFAAIGFTVGAGYHFLLYRAVEAVVGGIAVSRMAAIQLLRLVAAGAIFWMIAQAGAIPLIAAAGGFILSRFAAVRFVERRQ